MPPLPNQPWSTNLPGSQDVVGVEQPDLSNDSAPGANDGHRVLVEHLHALRDKLQYTAVEVGDSSEVPSGCLKARVTALELPHASDHEDSGGDEISVTNLSGVLADDQKANSIRTTSGPTLLTVGAIADGETLVRSGATVVGAAAVAPASHASSHQNGEETKSVLQDFQEFWQTIKIR
jgi:hypothetical protein